MTVHDDAAGEGVGMQRALRWLISLLLGAILVMLAILWWSGHPL